MTHQTLLWPLIPNRSGPALAQVSKHSCMIRLVYTGTLTHTLPIPAFKRPTFVCRACEQPNSRQ